jgi:hypothetical protein
VDERVSALNKKDEGDNENDECNDGKHTTKPPKVVYICSLSLDE